MPVNLKEYNGWLGEISKRYRQSQIKAAVAVNSEMLKFYFGLGLDIARMEKDQPWGSGFLKRLSLDLKMQMPEAECFSARNLYYMRYFFELYADIVILPQVGAKLVGGLEKLPQAGAKLSQARSRPENSRRIILDSLGFTSRRSTTFSRSRRTSRPSDFSSARRRTTRWSSGRLSHRSSQSAFPNIALARFCRRKSQATFRASPISNPQ